MNTATKYRFKPSPTTEDRNINLNELCMIRGRARSSTLRDIEAGLLPQPFKIGGRNYWRRSQIITIQDELLNQQSGNHPCGASCACKA